MLSKEEKTKESLKKIRAASLLLQDCTDPGMQNVLIREIEKGIRMIPEDHPTFELILWVRIEGWNDCITIADKVAITKHPIKVDWDCLYLHTMQESEALSILRKRHPEFARFWDLYDQEDSIYEIEVRSWNDVDGYLADLGGPFPLITVEREQK